MDETVARVLVVAKVLVADGIMTPDEKEFLNRLVQRFGLNRAQQSMVADLANLDEAAEVAASLPEAARREIVDEVLEAALVDGKLSPHETGAVARLTEILKLD